MTILHWYMFPDIENDMAYLNLLGGQAAAPIDSDEIEEELEREKGRGGEEEEEGPGEGKSFWTQEDTEEVWNVFKGYIIKYKSLNKCVPAHLIASTRAGRWPRFSNEQVRSKVCNLVKRLR